MNQPMLFDHVDGPPGELVVKRVNRETTKIPCEQWHYSGCQPSVITDAYGFWEHQEFQGVLIFGVPVSRSIHEEFNVDHENVRELLRVALKGHTVPITAALSKAIKDLKANHPNIELLISYADPHVGHTGYLYQAASWVYLGQPRRGEVMIINGKEMHPRSVVATYGTMAMDYLRKNVDPKVQHIVLEPKHKYAFGLNRRQRKLLAGIAQPYPKGKAA